MMRLLCDQWLVATFQRLRVLVSFLDLEASTCVFSVRFGARFGDNFDHASSPRLQCPQSQNGGWGAVRGNQRAVDLLPPHPLPNPRLEHRANLFAGRGSLMV